MHGPSFSENKLLKKRTGAGQLLGPFIGPTTRLMTVLRVGLGRCSIEISSKTFSICLWAKRYCFPEFVESSENRTPNPLAYVEKVLSEAILHGQSRPYVLSVR
jgi:hypothetical protein